MPIAKATPEKVDQKNHTLSRSLMVEKDRAGGDGAFNGKDDQFIWAAFKARDESAFIYIYQKYFPALVNYGHQFTRDSQLVEDSIQDLFIDLRKNRPNLTRTLTSIKPYLFKALKRRIIEYRRKAKYTLDNGDGVFTDFEIVPSVESKMIQSQMIEERLTRVKKAIAQLTDRQREALYYLYYENLSYSEIKDLMGMSHVRSARNLVYKAIAVLKEMAKLVAFLLLVKQ